ncbi:MAG: flagellar basal-body rod protein FlgG [Planctomycetota bacterium]|jgi:flagellar basal-body rod protein FlgG
MMRSLMTAASGMKAQQMQVDTIANNIANVNTHGFKKSRLSFRSMLYQTLREPGAPSAATQTDATGLQIGTGVEIAGSVKQFTPGELELTGNQMDLSIRGEGFFRVITPNGETRYTRNGSFRQNVSGEIVTSEGYVLEGSPTIPADALGISVGTDGTVSASTRADQPPTPIGNIQLHRFPNPSGLKAQGGNYYTETASSGNSIASTGGLNGAGTIEQGMLERSNVQTVDELVSLIVAQRNYEVNSRAIKVSDDMLQQVNQLIR